MSATAAIHVAKAKLGLDDETYRGMLRRVTGKTSSRDLTPAEAGRVLDELRRLGFEPASKQPASGFDGPFAPKLQALWISAYQLGVVNQRSDKALLAFVERQTGLSHVRFLRDASDARAAIEALKAWLAREAGVDWSPRRNVPAWQNSPKYRIVEAQWQGLIARGAVHIVGGDPGRTLAARATFETGRPSFEAFGDADWSTLMAALGRSLRIAVRAGRKAA